MLHTQIVLPRSNDFNGKFDDCFKCGSARAKQDGVELAAGKFICGNCWRSRAARKQGVISTLISEQRTK